MAGYLSLQGGCPPSEININNYFSATIGTLLVDVSSIATIGTIQSSFETSSLVGGYLGYVGTIGTILFGGSGGGAATGTIGTLQSGNVTASISGGIIQYIATIGTILGANINVTANVGTVTVATIISPSNIPFLGTLGTVLSVITMLGTVVTQRYLGPVTIQNAASIVGGFSTNMDMTLFDSVNVDIVTGTLTPASASIQVSLMAVETITGLTVASIVSSDWLTNGQRQRISAHESLGQTVAVAATLIGTATGITITAQRKS